MDLFSDIPEIFHFFGAGVLFPQPPGHLPWPCGSWRSGVLPRENRVFRICRGNVRPCVILAWLALGCRRSIRRVLRLWPAFSFVVAVTIILVTGAFIPSPSL